MQKNDAMDELLELSDKLIRQVSPDFKRYLLNKINWDNRLIGIKGARGTGKTTMILQWLQSRNPANGKAAYFSVDELYFTTNSIVDTGATFYRQGGKVLVFDEVHKYNNWASEIKNLYDRYSDLQIIFTGSSIIDISRQEGDLSRRALIYELPGLSYREYLQMNGILDMKAISLNTIIEKSNAVREMFPANFRPLEYFGKYLSKGYYPFSIEDEEGYFLRLRQLTRLIVEFDMAEIYGFDNRNARKMLQLLTIISQQVPFKPNLSKLAEKSQVHRNSLSNYLVFLEEARLIHMIYPSGISISTLQKPEKIFLDNTNLMIALSFNQAEKGALRETFVLNQLLVNHQVKYPKSGDFEVDEKFIFEVGGASKNIKQISNIENAYIVKDDMEYPAGKSIPLWLLGFLY